MDAAPTAEELDTIRATIQRAHELGIVLDDELIKKAAEIDRRFNEISNTVGMTLKSAIVSAADSLAEFIDGFRAFENQRNTTLQSRQTEIMRERLARYKVPKSVVFVEALPKIGPGKIDRQQLVATYG